MVAFPKFRLDANNRRKTILVALLVVALMPFGKQILNAPANMLDSFRLLNLSLKYDKNKNTCEGRFTGRLLVMKLGEMGKPQSAAEKLNEMIARQFATRPDFLEAIGDSYCTVLNIDPRNKLSSEEFVALCLPLDDMLVNYLARMRIRNDLNLRYHEGFPGNLTNNLAKAYKLHGAKDKSLFWRQECILANRTFSGGEKCRGLLHLAEVYLDCGLQASAKQTVNLAVALEDRSGLEPAGGLQYYLPHKLVERMLSLINAPLEYYVVRDFHKQANLSARGGDYLGAVRYLEQALKIEQRVLAVEPALAVYENQIADFYMRLKDFRAAEAHYKKALTIDEQIAKQKVDARQTKYHEQMTAADIARDLRKLANLNRLEKNYVVAVPLLLHAADVVKTALGNDCLENKEIVSDLIAVKKAQGRFAELEEMFKHDLAVAIANANGNQVDTRVTERRNQLARLYLERKEFIRAEELNKYTLALFEKKYGFNSYELEHCLDNLGDTYLEQAKFDLAEMQYTRAIRLSHGMFLTGIPLARRLDKYTELNRRRHRWTEAVGSCRHALNIREQYQSADSAELVTNRVRYKELLAEVKATGKASTNPFAK